MEHRSTPLSRRTVIAKLGLGVATGSAAMLATEAPSGAAATSGDDRNRSRSGGARRAAALAAAVATTAGTTYRSFTYGDFHTYAGMPVTVVPNFGAYSVDPFVVGLDLPQGARIVELALWAGATTGVDVRETNLGEFAWTTVAQATAGSGAGIVFVSAPVVGPLVVDNGQHAYGIEVYAHTAATFLTTVRVGYVAPGAFHAINPTRVYDSRDGTPAPLLGGKTRTVSLANATASFGGQANLVPAGASAVAYNLTVTATVGSGYLGVYPAGGSFSASAINWYAAGQTLANAATVALGGDRQVVVQAGGSGSTHLAIDVTGYYL